MKGKFTYLLVFTLLSMMSFSSIKEDNQDIKLLTTQTNFEVGKTIVLAFSSGGTNPMLYCSNSYGSTIVKPNQKDGSIQFEIPQHISNKIGVVNWQLIQSEQQLFGKLNINPKSEVASMETYIGPPSVEAGGTDYTMLVVVPTDALDNPIPEQSLVNAKHQFLDNEQSEIIKTKNLIAYKNIYSYNKSGRILVSSESLGINSKEFTVNVTAAIPTDFTLTFKRPHAYADGNQMTQFETSIIKDKHGNVVSDGTFVSFLIENDNKHILKTSGTTINGIATSRMIHPDKETNWSIKAFVEGMAESNTITLNYKQAVKDFEVVFSEDGRTIGVGPIRSFMQQMIPDGLQIKLTIYQSETRIDSNVKTSYNGFVWFRLKPEVIQKGEYKIVIETAGIQKTFNPKRVW